MGKQTQSFAVIGLGTFGSTVARELARFDNEVIGVDSNEKLVTAHAQDLTQALILDAREDGALREAGLETVDVGIVAIGTDMEASILSVINLKTLGVDTIWAKVARSSKAMTAPIASCMPMICCSCSESARTCANLLAASRWRDGGSASRCTRRGSARLRCWPRSMPFSF